MAYRLTSRAPRSSIFNSLSLTAKRAYSTAKESNYFTVELSPKTKDLSRLLQTVKSQIKIANSSRHDAAVILATPQYAQWLEEDGFMSEFVDLLSGSGKPTQFHVLGAVVDHIAPPVPSNKPIQGLSILRGKLDTILPGLWNREPPKAREDADRVAALTMDLGNPHITIPLTNTTFQNHKTSTLIVSRYDLSQGSPKLDFQIEKNSQHIALPVKKQLPSIDHLGLWAPLVPLTHPRVVTESFGNIVRRISINDESIPASNELEPAVDELHARKSDLVQSPMGIWAIITPPTFDHSGDTSSSVDPDPEETFSDGQSITELVASTSDHLAGLYKQGGRLYQILSGGGGWGAKKGLLSLDPQRTHFALSEEEEMQRFIQAMDGGNFVPVGSKIQFFASTETSTAEAVGTRETAIVFGTASKVESGTDSQTSQPDVCLLENHFGALSNEGIFVTSADAAAASTPGFNNDWKLNVPNSRIYVDV
ncbi:v-type c subunit family [Fusarium heterosporum]|uniref:V-type c subunit family n=1 Tax=Fusarium heterosporum TaxID=42747 RepID=A0A8H5T458_FUSHE|nr:v-type c subunit family [Fusarium heterosporum]